MKAFQVFLVGLLILVTIADAAYSYDFIYLTKDQNTNVPHSADKGLKIEFVENSSYEPLNGYDQAYKYCERDTWLNIFYDTSCCADKLTTALKSAPPGYSYSNIVYKANSTTFAGCVSRDKIFDHAHRRATYILVPFINSGRYSEAQVQHIASCTGNMLAEQFSLDPAPNKNHFNKMLRESLKNCESDSSSYQFSNSYPADDKTPVNDEDEDH